MSDRLNLSDRQARLLSKQALAAAEKRGYCAETKNILKDLGLPVEEPKRTVKVLVELSFETDKDGRAVVIDSDRISYRSDSGAVSLTDIRVTDGGGRRRELR